MVIPRDGFFYPTLTRIVDSFSCSHFFFFILKYAKMQFHMMTLLDVLGKIA